MKGNISKFLRSSLAFVMALSIGFTTVNAQTPLAEVDSTLFREIVQFQMEISLSIIKK